VPTPTVLLDAGANAECTPEWLVQFAQMGATYARHRYGIDEPKVGLLSIGEEPTKGTPLVKETHQLLAAGDWAARAAARSWATWRARHHVARPRRGGHRWVHRQRGAQDARGRHAVAGRAILAAFGTDETTRRPATCCSRRCCRSTRQLDPNNTGGAMLLGLNGVCIISHGSSNETAIVNAVKVAAEMVDADLVGAPSARRSGPLEASPAAAPPGRRSRAHKVREPATVLPGPSTETRSAACPPRPTSNRPR
jgi:phosphate acyltransferase